MRDLFPDLVGAPRSSTDAKIIVPEKYSADFDIKALMDSAKDPDTGLLRDLKIDDSDLPRASSFYDYCFRIIGDDAHPPWLIQMWIGLFLFAEVCPVCSDKRWLNLQWVVEHADRAMPSVEIVRFLKVLKHGKCPKCGRNKHDLIHNHGLRDYVELVNVLGQRSGKSSSAGLYASYLTHWYLKFPRLASVTNAMQKSTELTGTFVSLTFSKAFGLLWTPYTNIINDSRWWQSFHKMLDEHSLKYGVELYRKKDEYIKYFYKGIRMYPSGPTSTTLRGDTRILGVIDELGLFPLPSGNDEEDEVSGRANADEAHKSLSNSLVTVQGIHQELLAKGINAPPGLMIGVSSPISWRDKVMRLLGESKTEEGRKHILGINLATWQVNPHLTRESPIIAKAYASNPAKAERDFGANPPRVHMSFMKPSQVPLAAFILKNTHSMTYQYDLPGLLYGKVERYYKPKFPSVICLDAGEVNNSFCITGAHFDFVEQKVKVTTIIEVIPHEDRRIDFNSLYLNVILPVARDINAVVMLADRWQALDLLSRARADLGKQPRSDKPLCVASQYSPKRKDFDALVAMIEGGNYHFPLLSKADYDQVCTEYIDFRTLKGQPVKHLFLQMLTIKDLGEGKCPGKGEGFTDDLVRSLVLTTKIHSPKIMERLKQAYDEKWFEGVGKQGSSPMPVYISRGY